MSRKKSKLTLIKEESSKPRLIFCVAVYNAEKTLAKCLESVRPYADEVVVVEGRFLGKPGDTPHSTDRTLQIAQSFSCLISQAEDIPQHQQRDLYLIGRPGDFYFIVDSDEALEGDFGKEEILKGPYDVYGVWIRGQPRDMLTLRLYRHIGEKPRHNPGQLLMDGHGRLMDATHEGCMFATKWWLRHLRY